MSRYTKTHIHQLFPCPPNLTVVYEPCHELRRAHKEEVAALLAINPEATGEPGFPTLEAHVFPVLAYALLDILTLRTHDDVEISRRRVVEPLVLAQPEHQEDFGCLGPFVLSDIDEEWQDPEPIGNYYYAGIFQDGKPLGSAPSFR